MATETSAKSKVPMIPAADTSWLGPQPATSARSQAMPPIANLETALTKVGPHLAEALATLFEHYRQRGLQGETLSETEMRFARALAAYQLSQWSGKLMQDHLHAMVFGGAGAGKSTVCNLLVGSEVAEANPQAGYTRHPVAYFISREQHPDILWPRQLGPLQRHDLQEPANVDQSRFSWRQVLPEQVPDPDFLRRYVIWDGPDLTAKDATFYQSRVVEIAALAHVCIYVTSDERYNDQLTTNFLQGLLDAGKLVVVVLTKVSPLDREELVHLFQQQVMARLQHAENVVAIVTVPAPPPKKFHLLWTTEFPYGAELRQILLQLGQDVAERQQRSRQAAVGYLSAQQSKILAPLRRDLAEWQNWSELVRQAGNEIISRYDRIYAERVDYPEILAGREQFQQALHFSGSAGYLGLVVEWLRKPFRWLRQLRQRYLNVPTRPYSSEDQTLDRLRRDLLDQLLMVATSARHRHHFWRQLHEALQREAPALIETEYRRLRTEQRLEFQRRLKQTQQDIEQIITQRPWLLRSLRYGRLALDGVAISTSIVIAYYSGSWMLFFPVVFVGLGMGDELVHWGVHRVLQRYRAELVGLQREQTRELFRQTYLQKLLQLPSGLGPRLQRLADLNQQIPKLLQQLQVFFQPEPQPEASARQFSKGPNPSESSGTEPTPAPSNQHASAGAVAPAQNPADQADASLTSPVAPPKEGDRP